MFEFLLEGLFNFLGDWLLLRRLNPFRYVFSSKYRKATHQCWRQQSPSVITLDVLAGFFGLALALFLTLMTVFLVITLT